MEQRIGPTEHYVAFCVPDQAVDWICACGATAKIRGIRPGRVMTIACASCPEGLRLEGDYAGVYARSLEAGQHDDENIYWSGQMDD